MKVFCSGCKDVTPVLWISWLYEWFLGIAQTRMMMSMHFQSGRFASQEPCTAIPSLCNCCSLFLAGRYCKFRGCFQETADIFLHCIFKLAVTALSWWMSYWTSKLLWTKCINPLGTLLKLCLKPCKDGVLHHTPAYGIFEGVWKRGKRTGSQKQDFTLRHPAWPTPVTITWLTVIPG